MRPPIWPIATAAAGVYLTRSAYTLTFPTNITGNHGIVPAIGAAALGAATATTVTRLPWIRAATGAVLVPGYALVSIGNMWLHCLRSVTRPRPLTRVGA